jgi:hypothetical protein
MNESNSENEFPGPSLSIRSTVRLRLNRSLSCRELVPLRVRNAKHVYLKSDYDDCLGRPIELPPIFTRVDEVANRTRTIELLTTSEMHDFMYRVDNKQIRKFSFEFMTMLGRSSRRKIYYSI